MEENIAYIVILAFGALISLLYKLSYHGRRSGMDQHYGYGPMPSQYYYHRPMRRPGIGVGGALSIVAIFLLFLFGSQYEETKPKENYNDLGWTDRINEKQKYNYNYDYEEIEESQYAQNENNQNNIKHEAGIIPTPDIGSEENTASIQVEEWEEEEVIPQKNFRIQVIAGDNEYDAIDMAVEMKEATGLNAYVMLEVGGGAQSYKVMIGEFISNKAANKMIKKLGLDGHPFPKDITKKEYREIAQF
jgi:hypothetical protein